MQRKTHGFTISELLVVVGLGALLIGLVIVNITKSKEQTRDKLRVADMQNLRLALEEYKAVCGQYPQDIYGPLTKKSNGCPSGVSFDDFIPEIPTDPDTGDDYRYIGLESIPGFAGGANRCLDYHIGADLETEAGSFFSEDHDADKDNQKCSGATGTDFDGSDDASDGIYDFRSVNIPS